MRKYLVLISMLMTLTGLGSLFAGGGQEVETEIYLSQAPAYISPGNPDTGKDTLQIENIKLNIQDNAAIRRYELRIYNKRGEVIYSVAEENLEGRGFVGELLNLGEIPSVSVPQSMVWDGTDSSGQVVVDGEYFYQLYVRDSFDKVSSTAPLAVAVDTVAPEIVRMRSDMLIFSPNGDGKRDSINFDIQTGPGESWTVEILDKSGVAVYSETTSSEGDTAASDILAPLEFSWDGSKSDGSLANEADYRFRVSGVDRARNSVEESIDFQLSNAAANIILIIQNGNEHFSRYNRESMDFAVAITEVEGIASWKLEIEDSEGIVFRRYSGDQSNLPSMVGFDGMGNPGRPERGSVYLDDGKYLAIFSTTYANGNLSRSDPLQIYVDSSAPQASLSADSAPEGSELGKPLYFGGEAKPYLSLNFKYEEGVDWECVLVDESENETVVPLQSVLDAGVSFPFNWDGRNPVGGQQLLDGAYQLYLRAVDEAGNEGTSNIARFIKDSASRAETSIDLSGTVLAPGGDAGLEVVRITPVVPVTQGVEYFILTVVNDEDGRPYFSRKLRTVLPYVEWPGVRNNNTPVPDGSYHAELNIMYLNGDNPFAQSADSIVVGRSRPEVTADVDRRLFTPNGDGDRDVIFISQTSSEEDIWTGTFTNGDEEVVRTLSWEASVEDFQWDGTGDDGEVLPDGFYTYTVSSTNELGNLGSVKLFNLRIDNLSATINIRADEQVFSPNNDDYKDYVTLLPEVAMPENLRAWEVRLETADGLLHKTFQGGSNLPEEVIWNGENDARTVEDGEYKVTFFVEYKNGNYTQREADATVILVTNPPRDS